MDSYSFPKGQTHVVSIDSILSKKLLLLIYNFLSTLSKEIIFFQLIWVGHSRIYQTSLVSILRSFQSIGLNAKFLLCGNIIFQLRARNIQVFFVDCHTFLVMGLSKALTVLVMVQVCADKVNDTLIEPKNLDILLIFGKKIVIQKWQWLCLEA